MEDSNESERVNRPRNNPFTSEVVGPSEKLHEKLPCIGDVAVKQSNKLTAINRTETNK
jgi:hypothetical protein